MLEKDASKDKTEQIMCGIVDSVEQKLNGKSKHDIMSKTTMKMMTAKTSRYGCFLSRTRSTPERRRKQWMK